MFWETSGDSSSTGRIEFTDQGYILDLVKNLTLVGKMRLFNQLNRLFIKYSNMIV